MKIDTVLAGEYNSGTGNGVEINLSQHKRYLKTFKKFLPYGVIFWQWSYITDNVHPAFNLAKIVDGKIALNDNFDNFIKAKSIENCILLLIFVSNFFLNFKILCILLKII